MFQIFYANENCDFWKLKLFLERYISSIEIESKFGDSAIFLVQYKNLYELISLIEDLPKHKGILNIYSFHLLECSLGILLINLLSLEHPNKQGLGQRLSFLNSETKSIESHSARFLQLVYVFRQRFIIDIRNNFIFLFKSFLSTLVFIWILYILCQHDYKRFEKNAAFPIPYPSNGIMFMQQNVLSRQLLAAVEQYIMQGAKDIGGESDIYEYIRNYMVDHRMLSDINILTGAIFTEEKVEILFNDKRLNTIPNGLAHLMNALAM